MNVSTSSQDSFSKTSKWREIKMSNKDEFSKSKVEKEKIKFDASVLNDYVSLSQNNDVDLIKKPKS